MKKVICLLGLIIVMASCRVNQHVEFSEKLMPNMTMEQVKKIMYRNPIKSDFYQNIVECHYCNSSSRGAEYVVLYYKDGLLFEKRNYSVLRKEVKGSLGSCEKYVKMGNFKEPDSISEIRLK